MSCRSLGMMWSVNEGNGPAIAGPFLFVEICFGTSISYHGTWCIIARMLLEKSLMAMAKRMTPKNLRST